jgi:hypothetical protein
MIITGTTSWYDGDYISPIRKNKSSLKKEHKIDTGKSMSDKEVDNYIHEVSKLFKYNNSMLGEDNIK